MSLVSVVMRPTLLSISAALLVSGCSTGVETRVSSGGVNAILAGSYILASTAESAPDVRAARSLVAEKLAQRGFRQSDEAPLYLEVTFDVRDAALSLGDSQGSGSISGAKKRKPLQSCADREYRLGVTMTRIADGVELFRGRAAEYHCNMSAAEALPALVDAVLADFGNPRGNYVLKRNARD
jgi:hypothetical protein